MRLLRIPSPFKPEFETVEAVWGSSGTTRRVDALLLCWVKYEKQLRRLFSFLVFQHPKITEKTIEAIIDVMVKNRNLNPETFERGIKALGVSSVPNLIGSDHAMLETELKRIKKYRNKLMHGQISGQNITSNQIEKDVVTLIKWMVSLGSGADKKFGYDGIRRNTFRSAKSASNITVSKYPFSTASDFKSWLNGI